MNRFYATAALFAALLTSTGAHAIEYGFTAFDCIEIDSSIFQKEASGVGSSCAVVNRKTVAKNRAIDALEADASAECEDIRDFNPGFYDAYCQLVCEFNGYEESTGIDMCSYEVTDTDTWSQAGCFTGNKQYNRKEADVQCGCTCRTRL